MPRVLLAPLRYALGRRGMLASNAAEACGFIRNRPGMDRPEVQYTFMVGIMCRQRRPMCQAKRFVYSGLSASQSKRSRFTWPQR